ncbi:hypothetical protein B0T17DRAFT_541000 [Bombardia bombarda]|uniref:FAR1 domain-containing protein n=1 Tax=Bombardia bombarda TaxID=252184 RepID=A0AA39WGP8_9PEZI|nr:hypothetical protein B0T17DRAFT_541000 [Bombardia bombarda]
MHNAKHPSASKMTSNYISQQQFQPLPQMQQQQQQQQSNQYHQQQPQQTPQQSRTSTPSRPRETPIHPPVVPSASGGSRPTQAQILAYQAQKSREKALGHVQRGANIIAQAKAQQQAQDAQQVQAAQQALDTQRALNAQRALIHQQDMRGDYVEPQFHQIQPTQKPRSAEEIQRDIEIIALGRGHPHHMAAYRALKEQQQPQPQRMQQIQRSQQPQQYQAQHQTHRQQQHNEQAQQAHEAYEAQQQHQLATMQHQQVQPQQQQQRRLSTSSSHDETMREANDDSEGDAGTEDSSGVDEPNTAPGDSAAAAGGTPKVPYKAPLTQPITPLRLPAIRPTLMLGPYEEKGACMLAVQEYAISQGYMLVQSGCATAKTPSGKYATKAPVVRVDLQCDRGGICKNVGTGIRKRPTHRIGCPCRIKLVCKKRHASKWFIEIRSEEHNHDLDPNNMMSIASYRRWKRLRSGQPSVESQRERYDRLKKPKVIPPVPAPKFHTGQNKILEILLNKGADIDALDSTGRTPLHCAVEGERMDMVSLLVDRGADVTRLNVKGISLLHMAVEKGMEDAVVLESECGYQGKCAVCVSDAVCGWFGVNLLRRCSALDGYFYN